MKFKTKGSFFKSYKVDKNLVILINKKGEDPRTNFGMKTMT